MHTLEITVSLAVMLEFNVGFTLMLLEFFSTLKTGWKMQSYIINFLSFYS